MFIVTSYKGTIYVLLTEFVIPHVQAYIAYGSELPH